MRRSAPLGPRRRGAAPVAAGRGRGPGRSQPYGRSEAVLDVQEDGLRLDLAARPGVPPRPARAVQRRSCRPDTCWKKSRAATSAAGRSARPTGADRRDDAVAAGQGPRAIHVAALAAGVSVRAAGTAAHNMLARRLPTTCRRDDYTTRFEVPQVAVADAALHTGRLTIRRSPLVELRTLDRSGDADRPARGEGDSPHMRNDPTGVAANGDCPLFPRQSPLGIRPFEAYSFAAVPLRCGWPPRRPGPGVGHGRRRC